MSEKRYWGKHSEYGPYSVQPDGWPHRGEVLRNWRKANGLSAEYIGREYGLQTKGIPVSERWVTMAEKWNLIPQNESRRRILANIVGIPPLLFGLGSLEELLPEEVHVKNVSTTEPLKTLGFYSNIEMYEKLLHLFWKLDYTSTAQGMINDIESIIQNLQRSISGVSGTDQMQLYELLCGFYPLASTIYNDQRQHNEAFKHADDCVKLAENIKNNKMLAVALYQRGFISLQLSDIGVDRVTGMDRLNQQHVNAAITDFDRALPIATPRLEASILLDLALAQAMMKQRRAATTNLEKADKIIRRGKLEDGTFVDVFANVDRGRFHLGKAAVFVELKDYEEAEKELDSADEKVSPDQTRRHAWIDILRAKVYFGQRSYSVATEMALDALKVCKGINSKNTIFLIQNLHQRLISDKCSYRNAKIVNELTTALTLP